MRERFFSLHLATRFFVVGRPPVDAHSSPFHRPSVSAAAAGLWSHIPRAFQSPTTHFIVCLKLFWFVIHFWTFQRLLSQYVKRPQSLSLILSVVLLPAARCSERNRLTQTGRHDDSRVRRPLSRCPGCVTAGDRRGDY